MVDTMVRSRAWGLSVAVHAAAGTLVLMALGGGHAHRHAIEPAPQRVIWVEPAPRALGVPADAAVVPPAPVAPVDPPPVAATAPAKPVAAKKPRLVRTAKAKPPPADPAPRVEAAPADSVVIVPSAGSPGGSHDRIARGAPGGVGVAPLPLHAVASPPELLERVVPEYPARARSLEIEGQVVLEVVLDRSGRPEADIRVVKSVTALDAAAVAAVRRWRFRPARDLEGKPVRVVMEVPVRFMLR